MDAREQFISELGFEDIMTLVRLHLEQESIDLSTDIFQQPSSLLDQLISKGAWFEAMNHLDTSEGLSELRGGNFSYLLGQLGHNDDRLRLPFHLSYLYHSGPPNLIQKMCTLYPQGLTKKHRMIHPSGRRSDITSYPIHLALNQQARITVVESILDAAPKSIELRIQSADEDFLPIHLAAHNGCSVSIIRLLVDRYPEGVRVKSGIKKSTVLHLACSFRCPIETRAEMQAENTAAVVALLLERYPEAVRETNSSGHLPVQTVQTAAAAKILLNAYPDGAKIVDHEGLTVIHMACNDCFKWEIITPLLECFPEGAKLETPEGNFPLHFLLFSMNKVLEDVFLFGIPLKTKKLFEETFLELVRLHPQALLSNRMFANMFSLHGEELLSRNTLKRLACVFPDLFFHKDCIDHNPLRLRIHKAYKAIQVLSQQELLNYVGMFEMEQDDVIDGGQGMIYSRLDSKNEVPPFLGFLLGVTFRTIKTAKNNSSLESEQCENYSAFQMLLYCGFIFHPECFEGILKPVLQKRKRTDSTNTEEPSLLAQTDCDNNLPLHLIWNVVRAQNGTIVSEINIDVPLAVLGIMPVSILEQQCMMRNCAGDIAIHVALKNGYTFESGQCQKSVMTNMFLMKSAYLSDTAERLHPFMLAAVGGSGKQKTRLCASLATTFTLLRYFLGEANLTDFL